MYIGKITLSPCPNPKPNPCPKPQNLKGCPVATLNPVPCAQMSQMCVRR